MTSSAFGWIYLAGMVIAAGLLLAHEWQLMRDGSPMPGPIWQGIAVYAAIAVMWLPAALFILGSWISYRLRRGRKDGNPIEPMA